MEYIAFSLIGALLFLGTSTLDFYWSRDTSHQTGASSGTLVERPSHPSEVPVGSSKDELEDTPDSSIVEPQLLGYLASVLLQVPFALSVAGVL